jgi:hypothetical protein
MKVTGWLAGGVDGGVGGGVGVGKGCRAIGRQRECRAR